MRWLFALLACVAFSAAADAPFWCVLLETKDTTGQRIQFRYDEHSLRNKPQWTPGGRGPQLSLEAATKIAFDATLKQSPKATGVSFGDIKLLHNDCDYPAGKTVTWFWDFSVRPVIDSHPEDQHESPTVLPVKDIIILLDGEVVQPTVVK